MGGETPFGLYKLPFGGFERKEIKQLPPCDIGRELVQSIAARDLICSGNCCHWRPLSVHVFTLDVLRTEGYITVNDTKLQIEKNKAAI
jgi:hypothetical protein